MNTNDPQQKAALVAELILIQQWLSRYYAAFEKDAEVMQDLQTLGNKVSLAELYPPVLRYVPEAADAHLQAGGGSLFLIAILHAHVRQTKQLMQKVSDGAEYDASTSATIWYSAQRVMEDLSQALEQLAPELTFTTGLGYSEPAYMLLQNELPEPSHHTGWAAWCFCSTLPRRVPWTATTVAAPRHLPGR